MVLVVVVVLQWQLLALTVVSPDTELVVLMGIALLVLGVALQVL